MAQGKAQEVLKARHALESTEDIAGGAPIKQHPSMKVDRNSIEYEPLPGSQVRKGSRKHLLQSRREKDARKEQDEYDKWEASTTIWEIVAEGKMEKRLACHMTPVCDDPKFDGATPATTAFVDKPKARTRSEMFQQRKTQNLNEMAQTLEDCRGHFNAAERLRAREDQWTLARLSQKTGRSRRQMQENRKMERMSFEENRHNAYTTKHNLSKATWTQRPTQPFWHSQGPVVHGPLGKQGFVGNPDETSAARLFVKQRLHLKGERYNKYSDPEPDDFKAEYHAKHIPDPPQVITNVAKIAPFASAEHVNNLKNIKTKETNFTDYQLYFKVDPSTKNSAHDPMEDDPLYSCFTANKTFDPDTWMPPHLRGRHTGRGTLSEEFQASTQSSGGASQQLPDGSEVDSTEGGAEQSRPSTAKGSDGGRQSVERTVVKPGAKGGAKQRPMTSVPSKRGSAIEPSSGKPKVPRPWTSGGAREIRRGAQPYSLARTGSGEFKRPGVRTGAWQIIGDVEKSSGNAEQTGKAK